MVRILPKLRRLACATAFVGAAAIAPTIAAEPAQAATTFNAKQLCLYAGAQISTFNQVVAMTQTNINCAQVFINATTTWAQWDSPWFLNNFVSDSNWSQWATAPGTNRRLIITQSLVPGGVSSQSQWLQLGAAGAYTSYAQTLAEHLIAAGLGSSIIRLSPEMNGTWYPDSLGSTPAQWALWDQLWANTVIAMRSVPGANFQFDWNVNMGYRALPLTQIYPGDSVVDIISIDVYDNAAYGTTFAQRWAYEYSGPDGIKTVADFAAAHGKQFAIPEWGMNLLPSDQGYDGDAQFVNAIAAVVKNNNTAYQSYFYNYAMRDQLNADPGSVAAFQLHFGVNGDAVTASTVPAPTVPAPTVTRPQKPSPAGGTPTHRLVTKSRRPAKWHKRRSRKRPKPRNHERSAHRRK